MAAILAKFFFCAKKERGQYPAILTEQAWSIKDLLYGIKHQSMFCILAGQKPVSRAGEIRFILPSHGVRHIIKYTTTSNLGSLIAIS